MFRRIFGPCTAIVLATATVAASPAVAQNPATTASATAASPQDAIVTAYRKEQATTRPATRPSASSGTMHGGSQAGRASSDAANITTAAATWRAKTPGPALPSAAAGERPVAMLPPIDGVDGLQARRSSTGLPVAKPMGPRARHLAALLKDGRNPPLPMMIGQMLMIGFQGDDIDQPGPQRIARHIEEGRLGGVIFFRQNVKSEAAVKRLTHLFRSSAPPGMPVLIAVDQEGGQVQRLTGRVGFENTPSALDVAEEGEDAATRIYERLADELADWGFNVNLAPVVDLGNQRDNPVIARLGRAYSKDPSVVAAYAACFVEAHRKAGVLTALKHFPGHGSSRGDTHEGFVDVSTSWTETELAPYRTLVDLEMVDMVMVAHVHLAKYGPDGLPASLSAPLIEGLLRGRVGFDGVVISDDMEMGAIRKLGSPIHIATRAISAGNDILVYAGGAAGRGDLVDELQNRLSVAANDPLIRRRIEESYARIRSMKAVLPAIPLPDEAPADDSAAVATTRH